MTILAAPLPPVSGAYAGFRPVHRPVLCNSLYQPITTCRGTDTRRFWPVTRRLQPKMASPKGLEPGEKPCVRSCQALGSWRCSPDTGVLDWTHDLGTDRETLLRTQDSFRPKRIFTVFRPKEKELVVAPSALHAEPCSGQDFL